MNAKDSVDQAAKPTKFGTFGGVFTPCTLTILGVIMFLRLGQVVGQAGVFTAILIVLAAKTITTLTTLSLSAIATNTRVKGGGAYFLISRSLGVEFGGAIGVLFFLAQAISVAMYIIGFTEAFVDTFPAYTNNFVAIASFVNLATFICVYIGAGWTIKVQYFILAILAASLVSFFSGAVTQFDLVYLQANWTSEYLPGENAFTIFALFFPAVTGIMAGANMSGDLANPSRSIPRGTLSAIAVTAAIYLSLTLLLGGSRGAEELISNTMIIRNVAVWPVLITAGVFAATLSSALGSMMGAPRILQAFARDEIFTSLNFFGFGSGITNEPRRATVLTFFIAQVCILLGDLNAIAPIITMFFMITYGLINLATFYESITKNPSYRPTFKYCHWSTSLAGTIGCFAVMFLINWLWALVSILFIALLHWYIRWREVETRWGDLQSGLIFERARKSLLKLEEEVYHPKNWRPIIMALSGTGWTRPHIPIYGHWLTSGQGILTLAHVVTGGIEDHAERRDRYEKLLRTFIAKEGLEAFPAVACDETLIQGINALIQCHGIGGLRPNTVLLGWPRDASKAVDFGATIRMVARMNRSVLAARFLSHRMAEEPNSPPGDSDDNWDVPQGTIDVWWRGMENGALMMLLAHLLHQNPGWRDNPIRVLRMVENEQARSKVEEHLREIGAAARIHVRPFVVVSSESPEVVIPFTSKYASVVILGFKTPPEGEEIQMFDKLEAIAGNLPRVILVDSAGGMALES